VIAVSADGQTRAVVVDLLCNSPYYCGPLVAALRAEGILAELASPAFYLEPDFLAAYPVAPWIANLVVGVPRPRALRLAGRAVEVAINGMRLLWRINRRRYEVVHVQWMPLDHRQTVGMRLLRAVCDRAGVRLVFTAHNVLPHDDGDAHSDIVRRNLDRAHLVIAQTDHVASELRITVGTRAPIVVIPHGPLFADRPLPAAADAAARLDWPADPTVLFLGLLRPYKGLDLLSEAWPQVLGAHPEARLLVVGKVLDAAVRPELDRLRALPRVRVVDRYVSVGEMLDSYAVASVVVFPYRRISQSGALMTAAGVGRPSVITPLHGLVEQVRRFTSAVVANEVTGSAIAEALIDGLDRAPELLVAAANDQAALAASAGGWAAIAAATRRAYEGPVSPHR
jgi:glycosyltransferase involved in cell wall biosynthesis